LALSDILRALRRNVILVLLVATASVGITAFAVFSEPRSYTAYTQLFVSSNGAGANALQNSNLALARVPSYVALVNSPLVTEKVVTRLGLHESAGSIGSRVEASSPLQTAIIDVRVRDADARTAHDIAEAIGQEFGAVVEGLETPAGGQSPVKVTVVRPPTLPAYDWTPTALLLLLGLVLGLILGGSAAAIRELLDTRLKDVEQLRTKFGAPPLATIIAGRARGRPMVLDEGPSSSHPGEGFRQLRTNLQAIIAAEALHSIVVVGPEPDDASSAVAVNLAVSFGLAGARVLLVESNLRDPQLTNALGLTRVPGLCAVLREGARADESVQFWRAGKIHVLPAGEKPANPSELLASERMTGLIARMEKEFDLLIFDAPPILRVTDAAVLSARAGGAVITVRRHGTPANAVRRSVQALRDVNARVLGAVVLSKRSHEIDRSVRGARHALRAVGPPVVSESLINTAAAMPGDAGEAAPANGTSLRMTPQPVTAPPSAEHDDLPYTGVHYFGRYSPPPAAERFDYFGADAGGSPSRPMTLVDWPAARNRRDSEQ
jgi:polysaccharide biosynthesis transport protein